MIKKILVCTTSIAISVITIAKADNPPVCPIDQDARNLATTIIQKCPLKQIDCGDGIGRYHTCGYECGVKYDGACYTVATYGKSFSSLGEIGASVQTINTANYNISPLHCEFPAQEQGRQSSVYIERSDIPVWQCTPDSASHQ